MSDIRHDLLAEPVLRVREPAGTTATVSLATTLALLSRGVEIEFCALQAHQEHAWHAFLVQIAAIVLHRKSATVPFEDDDAWRDALRDLAGGTEAWCLVVPDLALPAFLQPPVPEASLTGFNRNESWDDWEVLVTARSHDIKRGRIGVPAVEHWVYVLVALQTMQGYSGNRMFGTARMNGGYGNRPCVAYAPSLSRPSRFQRDVAACLDARDGVVSLYGFDPEAGDALLWTLPWEGESAVGMERLDPWFIDCCRRVRLTWRERVIEAYRKGTDCARVAAKGLHGMTGDPWTPVNRIEPKALTPSKAGFGYDLTQELLFGGTYGAAAAGSILSADGESPWFVAWAMVRGGKTTEGIHERRLRVPPPVRALLRSTGGRDRLRDRAKRWVNSAKVAKLHVLGPAIRILVGAGDGMKAVRGRFLSAMDAAIDRVFFERLWATTERDDADAVWARDLVGLARAELEAAIRTVPTPAAARYRVIARAENLLEGCARKRFPEAFANVSRSST